MSVNSSNSLISHPSPGPGVQSVTTNSLPVSFAGLLAVLLVVNTLNNTAGGFTVVGRLSIALTVLATVAVTVIALPGHTFFSRTFWRILPILVALVVLHLPLLPDREYGERAWILAAQLVLMVAFLISLSCWQWGPSSLMVFSLAACCYFIANGVWWWASGTLWPFQSYFANPNALGAFAFAMLYFLGIQFVPLGRGIDRPFMVAGLLTAALLVLLSGARSTWLAALAAGCTYCCWWLCVRSKSSFHGWLLGSAMIVCGLTYIQAYCMESLHDEGHSAAILEHTGKRVNSGRDRLWPVLLDAVSARPLVGYGPGITIEDIHGMSLSAHSFYLQTVLQVGFGGLTLFVLLLWKIWGLFWPGRSDPIVRLSAAFFIGFLVHQAFEVSLTQVNLATGLIFWMICGVGISRAEQSASKHRMATAGASGGHLSGGRPGRNAPAFANSRGAVPRCSVQRRNDVQ